MIEKLVRNCEKIMDGFKTRGAFLLSGGSKNTNIMTIGWASLGIEWKKPVFIIMVRESRYTKELLEKTNEFTVTSPIDESMSDSLRICGQISGRDQDKIKELSLKTIKPKKNGVPSIKCKSVSVECSVIYKQKMSEQSLPRFINEQFYPTENLHIFYHGEILSVFENL